MADFLSRLAERTLGHVAVAAPRAEALFAPETPDVGFDAQPGLPEKAVAVTPAPQPPQRSIATTSPTREPPTEAHTPVQESLPDRLTTPKLGQQTGGFIDPQPQIERVSAHVPMHPVADTQPQQHLPQKIDDHESNTAEQPSASRVLVRHTMSLPEPAAPIGHVTRDRLDDTTLNAPLLRPSAPVSASVTEFDRRHADQRWSEAERRASPEGTPVIEIKIGRVEVRAVQPPPQTKPKPTVQPAPGLSLEEYLRQQNEGRR